MAKDVAENGSTLYECMNDAMRVRCWMLKKDTRCKMLCCVCVMLEDELGGRKHGRTFIGQGHK